MAAKRGCWPCLGAGLSGWRALHEKRERGRERGRRGLSEESTPKRLNEFAGRQNVREMDTLTQMQGGGDGDGRAAALMYRDVAE